MPEVWQAEVNPHLLYKQPGLKQFLGSEGGGWGRVGFPPPQLGARATGMCHPWGLQDLDFADPSSCGSLPTQSILSFL